jgi:hypothetical protein
MAWNAPIVAPAIQFIIGGEGATAVMGSLNIDDVRKAFDLEGPRGRLKLFICLAKLPFVVATPTPQSSIRFRSANVVFPHGKVRCFRHSLYWFRSVFRR